MKKLLSPFLLLITFFFSGCHSKTPQTYQGYVEGEFVNIASSQSGILTTLFVRRGDQIKAHGNLFALESDNEILARDQAIATLASAQAVLDDYQKGSRPQELAVIQAQLAQARANADNAHAQYERNTQLYHANTLSQQEFDLSASLDRTTAQKVKELENSLQVAQLPKRDDQIRAQKGQIHQLKATLAQAQWKIDQKSLKAPDTALVFDTLYRRGEFVPSGGIVVRLLPSENIKVRFFVPQRVAQHLILGQKVTLIRSDEPPLPAQITYVSTQAEYTPPIIYSNETNEQLTYMIEAYPTTPKAPLLHPGQPIEVAL